MHDANTLHRVVPQIITLDVLRKNVSQDSIATMHKKCSHSVRMYLMYWKEESVAGLVSEITIKF